MRAAPPACVASALSSADFPTTTALALQDVAKCYRAGVPGCFASARVLERLSLRVAPGEAVGVVGGEGAGKTTLLLCAAGLLRPDRGRVHWFGRQPGRLDAATSPVALVTSYGSAADRRAAVVRAVARRPPVLLLLLDDPLSAVESGLGGTPTAAIDSFVRRGGAVLLTARAPTALDGVATRLVSLRDGWLVDDREAAAFRDVRAAARQVAEPADGRDLARAVRCADPRRPAPGTRHRSVDPPQWGR